MLSLFPSRLLAHPWSGRRHFLYPTALLLLALLFGATDANA